MPHKAPRVLAFDPGYERLGVAVIEKQNGKEVLLHSECVRTPAKLEFAARLKLLGEAAEALIKEWQPQAVALEEVFFKNNAKTAMQVAEVRGVLAYLAVRAGLSVHHFTPTEVKVAVTGSGSGTKTSVALMVPRLLALPSRKRLDDELDAIAVGITCLAHWRAY
jgi:crossover junction endodeoxyribonuclease RuvC